MKHRTMTRLAFFATFSLVLGLGASAGAAPIQWNTTTLQGASDPLTSISDATALVNGTVHAALSVSGSFNTINFNLPDHSLGGVFTGDNSFPGITSSNESDFAVHATASLNIPTPGAYTFGVSSDDGFEMTVGSNFMEYAAQRSPGETYSTFTFASAGTYPVDLVFFQHDTAAELEVFASPGTFTSFGQSGSNFKLIGDTANGGLALVSTGAPEPSTVALLVPLLAGLLLRRKSTSR